MYIDLTSALKITLSTAAVLGFSDMALADEMSLSRTLIQGGLSGVLAFCLLVVWRALGEERTRRNEEGKAHAEKIERLGRDYSDKLEKAQEKFIEHLKHERRD